MLLNWGVARWKRELASDYRRLGSIPSRQAQRCAEILRAKRDEAESITAALIRRAHLPKDSRHSEDAVRLVLFDTMMSVPAASELRTDPHSLPPSIPKVRKAMLAHCSEVLGEPTNEGG